MTIKNLFIDVKAYIFRSIIMKQAVFKQMLHVGRVYGSFRMRGWLDSSMYLITWNYQLFSVETLINFSSPPLNRLLSPWRHKKSPKKSFDWFNPIIKIFCRLSFPTP